MVRRTQTIRGLLPNCLSVFDHFLELTLKGFKKSDVINHFADNFTNICSLQFLAKYIFYKFMEDERKIWVRFLIIGVIFFYVEKKM